MPWVFKTYQVELQALNISCLQFFLRALRSKIIHERSHSWKNIKQSVKFKKPGRSLSGGRQKNIYTGQFLFRVQQCLRHRGPLPYSTCAHGSFEEWLKNLLICFAWGQFTESGMVLGASWLPEAWVDCHVRHPLIKGKAKTTETKFAVIMNAFTWGAPMLGRNIRRGISQSGSF